MIEIYQRCYSNIHQISLIIFRTPNLVVVKCVEVRKKTNKQKQKQTKKKQTNKQTNTNKQPLIPGWAR